MPSVTTTSHIVDAGTKHIDGLAFRKCRSLSRVTLPEGLLAIGDAAFSYCSSLRQIQIPASVERIGVAAFCKSGLVSIQFLGIPKVIETDVFEDCVQMKEIVVPKGSRDMFVRKFGLPEDKVIKGKGQKQSVKPAGHIQAPQSEATYERQAVRSMRFSYNARYFQWAVGDAVDLRNVFSGPIELVGAVTYEFRRKALFIFVKSATVKNIKQEAMYELPTGTTSFAYKFQDKYASRTPRIFIFECDNGRMAKVFDEVKIMRINNDSITVKSLLKKQRIVN